MVKRPGKSLSSAFTLAAAALIIQTASAAATGPKGDFQDQIGHVVSGDFARHAPGCANHASRTAAHSQSDAQEFARRLLSGSSVSHGVRGQTLQPTLRAAASESPKARAATDFQSTVRQSLLGQRASLRAAL